MSGCAEKNVTFIPLSVQNLDIQIFGLELKNNALRSTLPIDFGTLNYNKLIFVVPSALFYQEIMTQVWDPCSDKLFNFIIMMMMIYFCCLVSSGGKKSVNPGKLGDKWRLWPSWTATIHRRRGGDDSFTMRTQGHCHSIGSIYGLKTTIIGY